MAGQVAVLTKTDEEISDSPVEQIEEERSKPKRLPPYAVVILNDNDHTFDYVVDTLMKVFRYTKEKSAKLTLEIHINGRSIVWSGSKEVAELKRDQIIGAGKDFYANKPVKYPLRVVLEPLL